MDAERLAWLTAMGVDVWERREAVVTPTATPGPSAPAPDPVVAHDAGDVESVVTPAPDRQWQTLAETVAACRRCALSETRTQTVFGAGDPHAAWMFVGEAPGAEEDRQGLPFVGRAGQLLTAMLFSVGLSREQVYIANVLKCRPPENRNPEPHEIACCEPYLVSQIALVQPSVIVAMGRFAAHSLLKTEEALSKLRGQVWRYQDRPLVVTYHPAYLLRNPVEKRKVWDDLLLARRTGEAT